MKGKNTFSFKINQSFLNVYNVSKLFYFSGVNKKDKYLTHKSISQHRASKSHARVISDLKKEKAHRIESELLGLTSDYPNTITNRHFRY